MIDNKTPNCIMKVLYYASHVWPKIRSLTSKNCPITHQEVHSQLHQSFQQVFLKLKNHSCGESKVLKQVVQVSCPIQWSGIDCGLFAVIICLHILEGTHIGPYIFTQYEITKLRTLLPRLLVKDRNERYHAIVLFSTVETLITPGQTDRQSD